MQCWEGIHFFANTNNGYIMIWLYSAYLIWVSFCISLLIWSDVHVHHYDRYGSVQERKALSHDF